MEKADLTLIEKHRKDNYQLDKLFKEHLELKERIHKMEGAKGLGANEEKELHLLKKKKLDGREKLEDLLKELR